ncbi:hypothetical protein ACC848_44085, partial [Rhizobium johnstonii]
VKPLHEHSELTGFARIRHSAGPVTFRDGSEPFMTMAMAGKRKAGGIVVAEINLKIVWTVVSEIRVGSRGQAFVLDRTGRL